MSTLVELDIWHLYNLLINGIPPDCEVDELVCGVSRVYVRSEAGYGCSIVVPGDTRPVNMISKQPGMKLRELATGIKSWNYIEASIGLAAINAWYNSVPVARDNGVNVAGSRFIEDRIYDPFISYQNAIRNKKVAVVGHFNYLEQLFQPICDLVILEQTPQAGDYPYAAADYILPYCDFIFITCNALTDKSLPHFLQLAQNKQVTIVGPATPMAPVLFQFGVTNLCGFVIKDGEKARRICSGQENYRIYSTGQKVSLRV